MGNFVNIGAMKAEAMAKAFGVDIEKGKHGTYEDTAENRRLNRVGQEYGHKAEEKQSAGKSGGSSAEEGGDISKHAAAASDEALKRAAQDPKAPEEVKVYAKKELEKRGSGEGKEKIEEKVTFRSEEAKTFDEHLNNYKSLDDSNKKALKDTVDKQLKKISDTLNSDKLSDEDRGRLEDFMADMLAFKTEIRKIDSKESDSVKSVGDVIKENMEELKKNVSEESSEKSEAELAEQDLNVLSEEEGSDEMFDELFNYFHWEDEESVSPENLKKFKNIEKHYNHKPGKQFDYYEEEDAEEYKLKMQEKGYIVVDFGHGSDEFVFELFKKKPKNKNK